MTQKISHRKPTDASRVQLTEGWEVTHWTHELGASEEELQQIIRRVGPDVTAIRESLASFGDSVATARTRR